MHFFKFIIFLMSALMRAFKNDFMANYYGVAIMARCQLDRSKSNLLNRNRAHDSMFSLSENTCSVKYHNK